MVHMNKYIIASTILLLFGCKSTEKCDAYGYINTTIITFPKMHIHDLNNNEWCCNEFPADTLVLNKIED